jgi:hypothetical protein
MSEYEFEPVRGVPGDLPEGEKILWQGAPHWARLAVDAFKIGWVSIYFLALIGWRAGDAIVSGQPISVVITQAVSVIPLACIAVLILTGLAWINARSTVYTLTNKRIVMRFGAALTKAINIPYSIVESAVADVKPNGSGTVAVKLVAPNRIPLLLLWPHRRPKTFRQPEPAFRSLKDASTCAPILAQALRIAHAQAHAVPLQSEAATIDQDKNIMSTSQPAMA